MKIKLLIVLTASLFLTACEVYMAPSNFWGQMFKSQSDSDYYRNRAQILVSKLTAKVEDYEINKVAVIDLVDEEGRVPILGEYFASKLVEAIARREPFRVAQRGEVQNVLDQLGLLPSQSYSKEEIQQIGNSLDAQALVNGKIIDLGTNLDVQLVLVDIVTGEVIASATESLLRNKFSKEMLRHF